MNRRNFFRLLAGMGVAAVVPLPTENRAKGDFADLIDPSIRDLIHGELATGFDDLRTSPLTIDSLKHACWATSSGQPDTVEWSIV